MAKGSKGSQTIVGQLWALAAEVDQVIARCRDESCGDTEQRCLATALRGLALKRQVVLDIDQVEQAARIEANLREANRNMRGQSGGIVTSDEAPPFTPSGGATH